MLAERYGGHLCDKDGNIVHERKAVRDLMDRFPVIDRHAQGTEFQVSHAVWTGREETN